MVQGVAITTRVVLTRVTCPVHKFFICTCRLWFGSSVCCDDSVSFFVFLAILHSMFFYSLALLFFASYFFFFVSPVWIKSEHDVYHIIPRIILTAVPRAPKISTLCLDNIMGSFVSQ